MPQNAIRDFTALMQKLVREAELAGAELIAEAAKERVPVDESAQTHLRDAIHVKETEDGVLVVAGDKTHWYGHLVEHGTSHSAPHPFLIPALEQEQGRVVGLISEAIRKAQ